MPGVAVTPLDDDLAIPWPIGPGEGMVLSTKDADGGRTLRRVLGD